MLFISRITKSYQHRFFSRVFRNVGIVAHIDAGKTTLTEGFLYLSGEKSYCGSIDSGSTTTDYLPDERTRGITIRSASVPIRWKDFIINLIDTPGHPDFSNEVDKSLLVCDGSLVILDATRGIENQTITAWDKSSSLNLPKILYFNKMDRIVNDGKMLGNSLKSVENFIQSRNAYLLTIQIPIFKKDSSEHRNNFIGVLDLVSLEATILRDGKSELFDIKSRYDLLPEISSDQWRIEREKLLEDLSLLDSEFAENSRLIRDKFSPEAVQLIENSIKKTMVNNCAVPILYGSGSKLIGLESPLNSIIKYFPCPQIQENNSSTYIRNIHKYLENIFEQRTKPFLYIFKIQFDPYHGLIALAKVYGSSITKNSKLINLNQTSSEKSCIFEKSNLIFKLFGNKLKPIEKIEVGDIIAIGCGPSSKIKSNDILVPVDKDTNIPQILSKIFVQGIPLNPFSHQKPVVFSVVHPKSQSDVKNLEKALNLMMREDESFTAKFSKDNHGWIIGGLGDLHLEIIQSKIFQDHKLNVTLGNITIAYNEMPIFNNDMKFRKSFSSEINCKERKIRLGVILEMSVSEKIQSKDESLSDVRFETIPKNTIIFDEGWIRSKVDGDLTAITQLKKSIETELEHFLEHAGRIGQNAVCNLCVKIANLVLLKNEEEKKIFLDSKITQKELNDYFKTNDGIWTIVKHAQGSLKRMIKENLAEYLRSHQRWLLIEPVMRIEIRIPSNKSAEIGEYLNELAIRKCDITKIDRHELEKIITAEGSLANLTGFSSQISKLSRGYASLSMCLENYKPIYVA